MIPPCLRYGRSSSHLVSAAVVLLVRRIATFLESLGKITLSQSVGARRPQQGPA